MRAVPWTTSPIKLWESVPHPDCLRLVLASVDAVLQLLLLQDLDLLVAFPEVRLQLVDPASEIPKLRHCIEITVA